MNQAEFESQITPFFWVEHTNSYSVNMSDIGHYKQEIFDSRADEGFEGGGYDWQSLAMVFLEEKMPQLEDKINFDSESSMFCVYSSDKEALQQFIIAFKKACENPPGIMDLFSRAELD